MRPSRTSEWPVGGLCRGPRTSTSREHDWLLRVRMRSVTDDRLRSRVPQRRRSDGNGERLIVVWSRPGPLWAPFTKPVNGCHVLKSPSAATGQHPSATQRRKTAPHHDAATLGYVRCRTLLVWPRLMERVRPRSAAKSWQTRATHHSLALLSRCACISFFSSSGVSFGRSIVSVTLLSVPVKANGGW